MSPSSVEVHQTYMQMILFGIAGIIVGLATGAAAWLGAALMIARWHGDG